MMREEEKQERFRSHLLRWYAQEGRRLPWREHITPYRTWVSEIMLQQTTEHEEMRASLCGAP